MDELPLLPETAGSVPIICGGIGGRIAVDTPPDTAQHLYGIPVVDPPRRGTSSVLRFITAGGRVADVTGRKVSGTGGHSDRDEGALCTLTPVS